MVEVTSQRAAQEAVVVDPMEVVRAWVTAVVVSAVECVDGEEAKQYLRHSIRRML